ncbi:MAG: UDP binding domain-containing protein, partial [Anaerolineales bacterium]
ANRHPRVEILNPGPGVGGHCISVDPWFLVESAPELTPLIRTAREVNDSQPEYVVRYLEKAVGMLSARKIAVLGLTFKADVDDIRESPSLEIVHLLDKRGAIISCFDPLAPEVTLPGKRALSAEEAADQAEALLLLVGHKEFRALQPENFIRRMAAPLAVDCLHVWDRARWEAGGFTFFQLGDRHGRLQGSAAP